MLGASKLFLSVLLLIVCRDTTSYRCCMMRSRITTHSLETLLKCNSEGVKSTEISSASIIVENEAEMDRLLLENDDDDGDEDENVTAGEVKLEELDDLDINLISDSDIDRSIQNAVQKLVDSGPKEPELSRVETFDNIYKVTLFLR
jgi:hypothetical protein